MSDTTLQLRRRTSGRCRHRCARWRSQRINGPAGGTSATDCDQLKLPQGARFGAATHCNEVWEAEPSPCPSMYSRKDATRARTLARRCPSALTKLVRALVDPESVRLVAPDPASAHALRQMLPGAWTQLTELDDGSAEIALDVAAAELPTALDVVQQWVNERHIPSVTVWVGGDDQVVKSRSS